MSFPKAKLHRYYEEMSCAPPPGRYDPKLDSKVKGAVKQTSKRFSDQLYNSASLESLDKANPSQVTFRTPQVTRKVISLTPRLKYLQEKKFDTPGSGSSVNSTKSDDKLAKASVLKKDVTRTDYQRLENELSALADKHWHELLDRELEISKLKEDLEELKTHEAELKLILEEKTEIELERSKELMEVKNNLDTCVEKINKERQEQQKYIEELKEDISLLQTKKEDLEGILAEKQSAIVTINDKYMDLENQLKTLREENGSYQEYIVKLKEKHTEVLNKVVAGSDQKIEELENILKLKVHKMEEANYVAQQAFQVDFQTKLNFVSHEFDLKTQDVESQMKKCVLKIKELEKMVDQKTKDFSKDIEEADERCRYMYRELCKVEEQRNDLLVSDLEKKLAIIDIQKKSDLFEKDWEQCKDKCKTYEITLNTMHNTVAALSERLLESESDVERLSEAEVDFERQKKLLEEKSQLLLSDITVLRDGMDRMERDIICEVATLKDHLAAKVDHLKAEAGKQIGALNNRIHEKQCAINALLNENDYYKKECEIKEEYVRDLRYKVKKYKEEISYLRNECSKIQDEFSERLTAEKNVCKVLCDKLENANGQIEELQSLKSNYDSQVSILMEKCEKFEIAEQASGKDILSLNHLNLQLSNKIKSLECEIETNQQIIDNKKENEVKQQQYIDELISDLVLEKERCVALEIEKDKIVDLMKASEFSNGEKSRKIEELLSKLEFNYKSLRNAEEKIIVIDEAKVKAEMQLIELENNAVELKNIMSQSQKQLEIRVSELESLLSSAKERIKTEIPNLEHDNINKAEYILELSLNIDSLKENITQSNTKISCLEVEKSSLNLQLEEAKSNISALENMLDEKNIVINNLTNQKNIVDAKYKDNLAQIDKLHHALNQQNNELKLSAENSMKLFEAEERIVELQERLSGAETDMKKSENLEEENKCLNDKLEELRLRLQAVIDERDKLDIQLGELMGHQNIHQKIKHVNQLKQTNKELREKADTLESENAKLKKKLAETCKENIVRAESTQKHKLNKKTLSPGVLKDRNH